MAITPYSSLSLTQLTLDSIQQEIAAIDAQAQQTLQNYERVILQNQATICSLDEEIEQLQQKVNQIKFTDIHSLEVAQHGPSDKYYDLSVKIESLKHHKDISWPCKISAAHQREQRAQQNFIERRKDTQAYYAYFAKRFALPGVKEQMEKIGFVGFPVIPPEFYP